ncbi:MAG: class II aldolase/adducin family protein [Ignavibacteriaceae bacterium]|nr:class II aldolase/adducin family protein [Ignavibacteriaceae bacterium]
MVSKKEIVEICRRVYKNKFVAAYDGNISAATESGTFFITRSAVNKGDVTEDDVLEINSDGKVISGSGKPSTENKLHLFIYNNRLDVKAVVHCHPLYATAFAAAGMAIDKPILPEVILTLGKIPLCKYATPSTDALHLSLEPYIKKSSVFLLGNHGAVAAGKNLKDAYFKMEKLEHTAKILFLANQLGGAKEISNEKLKELLSIAESTYGIKMNEE